MMIYRMDVVNDHWMKVLICVFVVSNVARVQSQYINITILNSAVTKGAVCLDGSPPAYHYDRGSGESVDNWLIYLEGGAWCANETDCINRSTNESTGSSTKMKPTRYFNGYLTRSRAINPDFYNWNRVFVRYCDGASFTADVEEVDPKNNLHFRGARILKAVVEELLEKGMNKATNVILGGGSAGGLAVMLQCDNFRALLPNNIPKVKCLSDCGFFIRGENLPAAKEIREAYFGSIVDFHRLAKQLPKSCTTRMDPRLCIFPENFAGDIKTPLFIVHSAFDEWQVGYDLVHLEPESWNSCFYNHTNCTSAQTKSIMDFGETLVKALPKQHSSTRGWFIDSCFFHEHITVDNIWTGRSMLKNKTIAEAVGDWFFDRSLFREIEDMKFPYNCTKLL